MTSQFFLHNIFNLDAKTGLDMCHAALKDRIFLCYKRSGTFISLCLIFWTFLSKLFKRTFLGGRKSSNFVELKFAKKILIIFFYVGPPKKSIFLTTIRGLYFRHFTHLHFTNYISFMMQTLWAAFVYCICSIKLFMLG